MDTTSTNQSNQTARTAQKDQVDQLDQQDQSTKTRNVTGYIHYNKDDDLTKIFDVLKDFRTRLSLKFSHHKDYIFFSLKSEHLNELAQKQPFRISHYRSKSEYKCDKTTADVLTKQSDSFLRMTWNEESGTVQFLSRTTGRIHMYLVMRIFNDSTINFDKTSYTVIKLQNNQDNEPETQTQTQTNTRTSANASASTSSSSGTRNTRPTRNFNSGNRFQQTESADGFTMVTHSRGSGSNTHTTTQNRNHNYNRNHTQSQSSDRVVPSGRTFAGRSSTNSKIEVEQSEPKPRTSRTTYRDMVSSKN